VKRPQNEGIVLLLIIVFVLSACTYNIPAPEFETEDIDSQLRAIISTKGLSGDPSIGRDLPSIDDSLPQLGMKLFFSKALSGTGDSACVSCHHPVLGGGDAIPMSIGIGAVDPDLLGPGRSHPEGPRIPRNAPTTFNSGIWDQVMFWDGRVESRGKTAAMNGDDGFGIRTPDTAYGYPDPQAGANLTEAQSRFPVTSEEEMRGFDFGTEAGNTLEVRDDRTRILLAQIIGDYGDGRGVLPTNNWLIEFQKAFDSTQSAEELITFGNIVKAIGEYERSQVFVDSLWKAYVQSDDDAISAAAKRGALLFFGAGNCASCHSSDFFTDEGFHVLAIPQIGVGKASGRYGDDDFGRYLETQNPEDKYAFRTPSLLNVEMTGPYGHDGAYDTLEGIVRHHLNPEQAIQNYDFSDLNPSIRVVNAEPYTHNALAQLKDNRVNGIKTVADAYFSDEQVDDLIAFLQALTDPCVKDRECLASWIPDDSIPDPDGKRLYAVDMEDNPD